MFSNYVDACHFRYVIDRLKSDVSSAVFKSDVCMGAMQSQKVRIGVLERKIDKLEKLHSMNGRTND